jgi:hypothetical protein
MVSCAGKTIGREWAALSAHFIAQPAAAGKTGGLRAVLFRPAHIAGPY